MQKVMFHERDDPLEYCWAGGWRRETLQTHAQNTGTRGKNKTNSNKITKILGIVPLVTGRTYFYILILRIRKYLIQEKFNHHIQTLFTNPTHSNPAIFVKDGPEVRAG